MIAILAEDSSDCDAIAAIVNKLLGQAKYRIRKKGYGGCPHLRRKGARDIVMLARDGCQRFIIAHDADDRTMEETRTLIEQSIVVPCPIAFHYCLSVPVQELETWLIADPTAINSVIPTMRFKGHRNPEEIRSPKEWLVRESRRSNGKPLYSPATFNAAVASVLDLDAVAARCRSFRAFRDCVGSWAD